MIYVHVPKHGVGGISNKLQYISKVWSLCPKNWFQRGISLWVVLYMFPHFLLQYSCQACFSPKDNMWSKEVFKILFIVFHSIAKILCQFLIHCFVTFVPNLAYLFPFELTHLLLVVFFNVLRISSLYFSFRNAVAAVMPFQKTCHCFARQAN
jgi:hypothetical protein